MPGASQTLCLDRIAQDPGVVVAALSTYNANSGRGSIVLRPLDPQGLSPMADKSALAAAVGAGAAAPSPRQGVQLFGSATPKVVASKKLPPANAVVDTPRVTTKLPSLKKKDEVARVSLDPVEAKGPEGVAVSPEVKDEILSKEKAKKSGAMIKYLRPADAILKKAPISNKSRLNEISDSSRLPKSGSETAPRKESQELEDYANLGISAVQPDVSTVVASIPRKAGKKLPGTKQPKSETTKIAKTAKRIGAKQKSSAADSISKNDQTREKVGKVKEKRARSPCIPRKRAPNSSAVASRAASPSIPSESFLRKSNITCSKIVLV